MFLEKLFSSKTLVLLAGASFALAASPIKAQTAPTLCKENEEPVFSCQIEGSKPVTSISLCASKDFSGAAGYLKFRVGNSKKIELETPKSNQSGLAYFTYQSDVSKEFGDHGREKTTFSIKVDQEGNQAIFSSRFNDVNKTPLSSGMGEPESDNVVACKKTTVIDKLQDPKFNLKGLLKQVK